jgi:hypothetical protein
MYNVFSKSLPHAEAVVNSAKASSAKPSPALRPKNGRPKNGRLKNGRLVHPQDASDIVSGSSG